MADVIVVFQDTDIREEEGVESYVWGDKIRLAIKMPCHFFIPGKGRIGEPGDYIVQCVSGTLTIVGKSTFERNFKCLRL